MDEITETIERLRSAPPHHCFAITSEALDKQFGGDIRKVPVPDYPHAMIWDARTNNLVISRLADGEDVWKLLERGAAAEGLEYDEMPESTQKLADAVISAHLDGMDEEDAISLLVRLGMCEEFADELLADNRIAASEG